MKTHMASWSRSILPVAILAMALGAQACSSNAGTDNATNAHPASASVYEVAIVDDAGIAPDPGTDSGADAGCISDDNFCCDCTCGDDPVATAPATTRSIEMAVAADGGGTSGPTNLCNTIVKDATAEKCKAKQPKCGAAIGAVLLALNCSGPWNNESTQQFCDSVNEAIAQVLEQCDKNTQSKLDIDDALKNAQAYCNAVTGPKNPGTTSTY